MAISFAEILVCFQPEVSVEQFLATGDIGRLAATNKRLHCFWQSLLRALRSSPFVRLAVVRSRFDRLLQSLNDAVRR